MASPDPVVLLTRPQGENERLAALLRAAGEDVAIAPCVALAPVAPAPVRAAALALGRDDVLVLTSVAGVAALAAALDGAPLAAPVAVVGAATADAAVAAGLAVAFRPRVQSGAGLAGELPLPRGTVLLARSDRAADDLPRMLRERGARVREVVAYRTVPLAARPAGTPAVVVFASPSAVDGFALGATLGAARAVAIGPSTAARVRERLAVEPVVAAEPSDAGLRDAVISALEGSRVRIAR